MNAPRLVLGAMYFGTRIDAATSFTLLDHFAAAGGRWIDTANLYASWEPGEPGQSERVLGEWFRANPGVREQMLVASKVGLDRVETGIGRPAAEGLGEQAVVRALDRSLGRLGLEYLDLYWAHGEDRLTPFAEQVEALSGTVASGRVRRLGLSNHAAWRAERFRSAAAALASIHRRAGRGCPDRVLIGLRGFGRG